MYGKVEKIIQKIQIKNISDLISSKYGKMRKEDVIINKEEAKDKYEAYEYYYRRKPRSPSVMKLEDSGYYRNNKELSFKEAMEVEKKAEKYEVIKANII